MVLDMESNIKYDRTDLDLLFGVMLDWGVPLSLTHVTDILVGKHVHFVNETDLVASFDENIPETVVRDIAKRKPLRVVFRYSPFGSSPEKINVSEIFKTISSDTAIKVIWTPPDKPYQIPQLPLPIDLETKAILKAALSANKRLSELKGVVKTMPNETILIDTLALQEARDKFGHWKHNNNTGWALQSWTDGQTIHDPSRKRGSKLCRGTEKRVQFSI